MATAVQHRRNTHTLHSAFAGQAGEFSFDTDAGMIHGHKGDGRPGGIPVGGGLMHALGFGFRPGSNAYAAANKTALLNMFSVITAEGSGTVLFPDGDFYINPSFTGTIANVPSNTTILMGKRTRLITYLNGDTERHIILRINRATNVHIRGGELVGDRDAPGGGSYGYGIGIIGADAFKSTNIVIEGVVIRDFVTDGFYVEDGDNIQVDRMECYNNKRSGCSVTRGSNIRINGKFWGSNGAAPQTGLNIETEGTSDVTNVVLDRCEFGGNTGIGCYVHKGTGAGLPIGIKIIEPVFHSNTGVALNFIQAKNVQVTNPRFLSNVADNINIDNCDNVQVNGHRIDGGNRGVYILDSRYVDVVRGQINDTGDTAIEVRDDNRATRPTKRVRIIGNDIENTAEYGVTFAGVAGVVSGNRVNKAQKDGYAITGARHLVSKNEAYEVGKAVDNTYRGIVDTSWDSSIVDNVIRECQMVQSGTCQAGGAATATLASTAIDLDDVLIGYVLEITGGTGAGQAEVMTDYVGSTKVATVANAWSVVPDATSTYRVRGVGNRPKHGILLAGTETYHRNNDCRNSGKTSDFLDGATRGEAGNMYGTGKSSGTFIDMEELSSDPSAPSANRVRLFLKDTGGGKSQLTARFATGAVQVVATEP